MANGRAAVLDEAKTESPGREDDIGHGPYRQDAHAVVIGINNYHDPSVNNLRYARADAEAIYAVLTDPNLGRFDPANVSLLLDEEATRKNIVSAIATQLPRRVHDKNTVCVYYAGHGAPDVDQTSTSNDGLEKYLIPHDGYLDDLRSTAINMDEIKRYFGYINAGQLIFYIDSCYSGAAGGRTLSRSDVQLRASLNDEFLDNLGNEGRLILAACDVNEVSLEEPELAHGVFTYYLIEGMKGAADKDGDGMVTVDELYDYVWENVTRRARELRGKMTPLRKGSVTGRVYITQYETPEMKRCRALHQRAEASYEAGDLETAWEIWQEISAAPYEHEGAKHGLDAIRAKRNERTALRMAKQRKLLELYNAKELPLEEYSAGLALLRDGQNELDSASQQKLHFLESLLSGKLTAKSYLDTVSLLDTKAREEPAGNPDGNDPTRSEPAAGTSGQPDNDEGSGAPGESAGIADSDVDQTGSPGIAISAPEPATHSNPGESTPPVALTQTQNPKTLPFLALSMIFAGAISLSFMPLWHGYSLEANQGQDIWTGMTFLKLLVASVLMALVVFRANLGQSASRNLQIVVALFVTALICRLLWSRGLQTEGAILNIPIIAAVIFSAVRNFLFSLPLRMIDPAINKKAVIIFLLGGAIGTAIHFYGGMNEWGRISVWAAELAPSVALAIALRSANPRFRMQHAGIIIFAWIIGSEVASYASHTILLWSDIQTSSMFPARIVYQIVWTLICGGAAVYVVLRTRKSPPLPADAS